MKVTYDLSRSPATFDFTHFLANAERRRLESGESSLFISFAKGERNVSQRDHDFTTERKDWRLENLLVPMCRLLPSVAGYSVSDEAGEAQSVPYKPEQFIDVLRPSDGARSAVVDMTRLNAGMVTITLRQSDFQIARNSDIEELKKLAGWLKDHGFAPVFVPDTEALLSGKHVDTGFKEFHAGALNVDMRLALYENAVLNIFTSGGPFGLAMYGGASLLLCKNVVPEVPSCTVDVQARLGYIPGDPLANEWQRIVPCDDSFDALMPQVRDFLAVCKTRKRQIRRVAVFSVLGKRRVENMQAAMKRGLKEAVQGFDRERPMAIVCYGPSLKDSYKRLLSADEDIYSVSGAHDFLLEQGITPMGHIESDPRPHKAHFTRNARDGIAYYIASCCDALVFDQLEGKDVRLWHCWDSAEFELAMAKIDPNAMLVGGGTNVGLRAIALGSVLGYTKFSIYGMDCSFAGDGKDVIQHAGEHSGKRQRTMDVECGGRHFVSSPQMVTACNEAVPWFYDLRNIGVEIMVHGDGLLQHRLRMDQEAHERRLREKLAA